MSDPIPANVKVYDRPEKKGLPALYIAVGVIVLLIVGFFIYRALTPVTAAPATGTTHSSKVLHPRGQRHFANTTVEKSLSEGKTDENHRWFV